jgi:hypothetical protein
MMILRVEKDGVGPYQVDPSSHRLYAEDLPLADIWDASGPFKPMPLFPPAHDEVFGFSSLAQLLSWFDEEELTVLMEDGFEIVQYEVDRAWVTFEPFQCAFVPFRARTVQVFTSLTELEESCGLFC